MGYKNPDKNSEIPDRDTRERLRANLTDPAKQLKESLDLNGQINFDRVHTALLDFKDCWLDEFKNPKLANGLEDNIKNFIEEFERILEIISRQYYKEGSFDKAVVQYFQVLIRLILEHPNFGIVEQQCPRIKGKLEQFCKPIITE